MIIISHASALALYRIPRACQIIMRNRRDGLVGIDPARVEAPGAADAKRIAATLGIPLPLHTLVFHANDRRRTPQSRCHLCGSLLPEAAVIHLDGELYVCAPEVAFIQLCCNSDPENRWMLGSELASDFAINPAGRKGLVKRPALITPDSLGAALDALPDLPGARKAREAMPRLICHARSPKEIELALLLTLPRKLGGRGIASVAVNHHIDLSPQAQAIARRAYLVADLFLLAALIDLEYDSNDNHLTREMNESDKRRANALHAVGLRLYSITAGQLHDWQTFDTIARQLAFETNTVRRTTSQAIEAKQCTLWERLLFGTRRNGRTTLLGERGRGGTTPLDAY